MKRTIALFLGLLLLVPSLALAGSTTTHGFYKPALNETGYATSFANGADTFDSAIWTALGLLAPIANPTFTGTVTGTFTGNVTGNCSGSSGSCTGNSATATKFAATKTINGVAFDGSGNITVPSEPIVGTVASSATAYPSTNGTSGGTKVTHFTITALAGASTIEIPVGSWTDGEQLVIRIKDNGTARALTWITSAGGYRASDTNPGALPTTTVLSKTMYLKFIYNSADSYFDFVGLANNF